MFISTVMSNDTRIKREGEQELCSTPLLCIITKLVGILLDSQI